MKTIILITILFFNVIGVSAQGSAKVKPKKVYKVWVNLVTKPYKVKGFLNKVTDSTVVLSKKDILSNPTLNLEKPIELNMDNIESVYVRRKNKLG